MVRLVEVSRIARRGCFRMLNRVFSVYPANVCQRLPAGSSMPPADIMTASSISPIPRAEQVLSGFPICCGDFHFSVRRPAAAS